jgi:hypothetical protein
MYAERGLARQRVSVWLYEGRLHIEYQQTMLARYAATYSREKKRLQSVTGPELRKTKFADLQLELWELDDEQWRKIVERVQRSSTRQMPHVEKVEQLSFQTASVLWLLLVIVKPTV